MLPSCSLTIIILKRPKYDTAESLSNDLNLRGTESIPFNVGCNAGN